MANLLVKDSREQMANIATEARSKLNEVTDETPKERVAEIEREFDVMMSDHDKLKARISAKSELQKPWLRLMSQWPRRFQCKRGAQHQRLIMDCRWIIATRLPKWWQRVETPM